MLASKSCRTVLKSAHENYKLGNLGYNVSTYNFNRCSKISHTPTYYNDGYTSCTTEYSYNDFNFIYDAEYGMQDPVSGIFSFGVSQELLYQIFCPVFTSIEGEWTEDETIPD